MVISFFVSDFEELIIPTVESTIGLVACYVPTSMKTAMTKIQEFAKLLQQENQIQIKKEQTKFAKIIHQIWKEPVKWDNSLDIPIDFQLLTSKEKQVAKSLRNVGVGKVVSYGKLAEKVGINNGARFIGNCMAKNPLPLIIPCHRVLPANMSLGNYSAGGSPVKKHLLLKEGYKFAS